MLKAQLFFSSNKMLCIFFLKGSLLDFFFNQKNGSILGLYSCTVGSLIKLAAVVLMSLSVCVPLILL